MVFGEENAGSTDILLKLQKSSGCLNHILLLTKSIQQVCGKLGIELYKIQHLTNCIE